MDQNARARARGEEICPSEVDSVEYVDGREWRSRDERWKYAPEVRRGIGCGSKHIEAEGAREREESESRRSRSASTARGSLRHRRGDLVFEGDKLELRNDE